MKTIGLVGGTGWVSTAEYYRMINEETNRRLGGLKFARCVLYSLDYGEIDRCNRNEDTEGVYTLLLDAARKLLGAGAECLVLCANTLHMHADRLSQGLPLPLIHIASATASEVLRHKIRTVGLLGTRKTMELDFYKKRLNQAGIEVLVPDKEEREYINDTITTELLKSRFLPQSRQRFRDIIQGLGSRGAKGIVLGCTEIPLLIRQEDVDLPVFNTTFIHASAAVDFALGD